MDAKLKEISIVFTDIKDFFKNTLDRLAPKETMEFLEEYYEKVGEVIEKYDGTIDNIMGDSIMITFNTEKEQENHAELAVKTALEIQDLLVNWKDGKEDIRRTGIGVNTGQAMVGYLGTKKHKTLTAIGESVNFAAIFCGIAKAHEVIVGEETFEIVKDQVEYAVIEEKIRGQEFKFYLVTGLK